MSSTQPDGQPARQTDRPTDTHTHTDSLTCHSPGYQPAVSALYWPPCGSEDQQNSPGEPQNYLDEHDRNQKTFIIKEESKVFLLVGQVGSGDVLSPDPTLITVFLCFACFEREKKKKISGSDSNSNKDSQLSWLLFGQHTELQSISKPSE